MMHKPYTENVRKSEDPNEPVAGASSSIKAWISNLGGPVLRKDKIPQRGLIRRSACAPWTVHGLPSPAPLLATPGSHRSL